VKPVPRILEGYPAFVRLENHPYGIYEKKFNPIIIKYIAPIP
jgi:hypothetical protein